VTEAPNNHDIFEKFFTEKNSEKSSNSEVSSKSEILREEKN